MVTLLVREMARRKRGSGTKVSTRKSPRNTRKTNGLPQEAVNGLLEPSGSEKESEETSVVQDDDNVKPLEFPLTCRTPVEMCQKDSNLEELVPAHVHKKFGAVRCVVSEEEPVSSVEVQQEGETTEVMWEEAVVEETILCEGMEVEYTGPDDQQMVIVSRDDEVLQVIGIPKELESQVILVKEVDYDMGQEDEDRGIEEIHAVKTLTLVDSEDSSGPLRGFEDASQDSEVSVRGVELEIQGEEEVGGPQIDSDSQQGLMSLLQVASAEHQAAMLDDESSLLVVTAARDAEDSSRDSSKKERETSSDDVDTRDTEANYPETMERREMALVLGIEYNSQEGTNAMESNGAHTSGMLMEEEEDTSSAIKENTNTSDLFVPPIVEENSNHKTTEEENSSQEEILNDPPPLFRGSDEDSEKKQHNQPSFRSRSGSTDTTGSESSSSCSAGIRRSNRIRSIGVTRQRIRTRWEAVPEQKLSDSLKKVEYPVTVDSPHTYSDKEICCEVKSDFRDSSDGSSGPDVHSDRDSSEVNVIKVPVPLSFPALSQTLSSITVPSFDIDISKPVKVKSRWRRSSELEMVGNKNIDGELVMTSPTPSMSPSPRLTLSPKTSIHQRPPLGVIAPSISPQSVVSPSSPLLDITSFSVSAEQVLKEPTQDNLEMEEKLRQFVPLPENEYLTNRSTSKEAKRMVCDCFLTQEEIIRGEMGCGEDCLNRLLMLEWNTGGLQFPEKITAASIVYKAAATYGLVWEIGARCPVSERCTNKRFQKQDYAKCEVFKTEKKGFGLRALEDLTTGSFLLEYVGEVLDPKEFRRRAKEYSKDKNRHYYFMALKSDSIIDATMKGNISRFINHSCDPNAETQKWTVNGELRIGFFCKRSIVSGEEVTFDYQLQRYGKEAQRCHCETALCRGWIGEDPDKEREKHERKERKDRESKRKKEERRKDVKEFLDDMDLEEEIEKLCVSGLKNRNHTLTLSRLMVRAEDSQSREQLLKLLQGGEPACRRLFLDYHGLRLIWSWMMNLGCTNQTNSLSLRLEILQTLSKLPIPNKTMLQESKVFGVVEKWSVDIGSDSSANSTPCHEMDRKERFVP
uniref:Histone-lysine N-methyltransferase SETD2 n=1 Tax=Timema monikensis TaxID=170555 RepID=A0A7R9EDT2_9NEOP|nr:unnamed protein product [Timema monikensis]